MSLFNKPVQAESNNRLISTPGNHPVRITSIELVTPEKSDAVFHDGIQQLKVTGTNDDGEFISAFFNECAFAQPDDLSTAQKQSGKFASKEYEGTVYVTDKKSGKRVVLPETHPKSISAKSIYANLGASCGIEGEFVASDLKGARCIFVCKEEARGASTRIKVVATRPYKEVVKAEAEF